MQKLFYGLVNGSTGDPALYLELGGRAALFDCGHLLGFRTARLHRVRHLFLSHCHVDHFFGFDWLLRVQLGEDRAFAVHGPVGTADRVAAKLDGYTWNIDMDFALDLAVHEVEPGVVRRSRFRVKHGLERRPRDEERARAGDVVLETADWRVRACEVDHGTPCLAYAFEQKRGLRVLDGELERLALPRGAWLRELKAAVLEGAPRDREIRVDGRAFALGELADRVTVEAPGVRVAYVSDTVLTDEVRARVVDLARGARSFFCEAKYLEADRDKARASRHLTAREAGMLAREAGVRELVLFHPSPKYQDDYGRLLREAAREFEAVRFQDQAGAIAPAPEAAAG